MLYHIFIDHVVDGKSKTSLMSDCSEEAVKSIVSQYLQNKIFDFLGNAIEPDELERISIFSSESFYIEIMLPNGKKAINEPVNVVRDLFRRGQISGVDFKTPNFLLSVNHVDGLSEEVTLDPLNWDRFRVLGHQMLDFMIDYIRDIRSKQTLIPDKVAIDAICVPLSDEGEGEEHVFEVFRRSILPFSFVISSPRLWGAVLGQGSPYGMLAEMLRAGMNGAQEFAFAEAKVNTQVIDWVKELLEFPKEAGGVIVSGGSEANFTALAVARNAKAGFDIKARGVQGVKQKMTLYCGDETHRCLERSVELLGLGNEALRKIPTDDNCRVKLDVLETAIEVDREMGYHPFCLIGCAGTTNIGAFDDFNALADLAEKENMWFHVDGAFGAWVKISSTHKHLADAMERADSLAVDFHKWMNMPYGIGCTLVKNRLSHFSTFVYGHEAEYLKSAFDLSEDQLTNPHNLALPLSRNFSSLKAYMLLRAYGKKKYSKLVQQNLEQITYLANLIEKDPELEITAPVVSNVVCFRFKPTGLDEATIEKLNKMIMDDVNKNAFWMISDTTIKGKYMLRACNVNHRTKKTDMDFLVNEIKRIGTYACDCLDPNS